MSESEKFRRRSEARSYFDVHSINESPGEEVDVEAKTPLSAMMSLRLDQEHFKKLKVLARAQKVGATTLARTILQEALDEPEGQSRVRSLDYDGIREEAARVIAESKVPYGGETPDFLVIPAAELERLVKMMQEVLQELWLHTLQSKAVTITPQHDLHEKLRELETARE